MAELAASAAFRQPRYLLDQFAERTDDLSRRLQMAFKTGLSFKRQSCQNLTGRLNALNPLGILERGYAVTFGPAGKVLKSVQGITAGDEITTRLHKGSLVSKVTEVIKEK